MTFYLNDEPIGRADDVELEGVDISDLKVWKDETFTAEVDTSEWTADMWRDVFGFIPIIRCKVCKYYANEVAYEDMSFCLNKKLRSHPLYSLIVKENFYCGYAERKE